MEFIVDTFSKLGSLPLIEYVAVGFVFTAVFSYVYRLMGVKL